jgi:hypothetical protein
MPFREDLRGRWRCANFSHDYLSDFRRMVFSSNRAALAITAFIDHVIDVRLLGTAKQMSGIDARPAIAMMQNKQARRNWPAMLFIGVAVRKYRLFRQGMEHPIAGGDFPSRPFPAGVWSRAFLDIGFETLLCRHPFMIAPLLVKRVTMPTPLCVVP